MGTRGSCRGHQSPTRGSHYPHSCQEQRRDHQGHINYIILDPTLDVLTPGVLCSQGLPVGTVDAGRRQTAYLFRGVGEPSHSAPFNLGVSRSVAPTYKVNQPHHSASAYSASTLPSHRDHSESFLCLCLPPPPDQPSTPLPGPAWCAVAPWGRSVSNNSFPTFLVPMAAVS